VRDPSGCSGSLWGTTTQGDLLKLSERLLSVTGAQMIGWSLLSESLMEIMQRDVRRVLIPMGAVLLLLLGLAFRKISGIALSLVTLGFSFLCLLGLMALMGWSWNLMWVSWRSWAGPGIS